jgi:hypothetical protein
MAEKEPCINCGRLRINRGRGLCSSCKKKAIIADELEAKYPKLNKSKKTPTYRKFRKKDALVEGHWEVVPNSGGIKVWKGRIPND